MEKKDTKNKIKVSIWDLSDDNNARGCGYCKKDGIRQKSWYRFGFTSNEYPPRIYEEMMLHGWRRCGDFTYKVDLEKTCCKAYTCRLNVLDYKISRQQKKVMKNFRKYLKGEDIENKSKISNQNEEKKDIKNNKIISLNDKYSDLILKSLLDYVNSGMYLEVIKENCFNEKNESIFHKEKNNLDDIKVIRNKERKFGDYSSNIILLIGNYYMKFKKDNVIKELKEKKQKQKNVEIQKDKLNLFNQLFLSIKDFYNKSNNKDYLLYEISLSEKTGHINFIIKDKENYENYLKLFQSSLQSPKNKENKDNKKNKEVKIDKEKNKINKSNKPNQQEMYKLPYFEEIICEPIILLNELKHKYTCEFTSKIRLTEEDERLEIYKKYQAAIHKDNPDNISAERFNNCWGLSNLTLDENSLIPLPKDLGKKTKYPDFFPKYYGTYNLIHRIDGKIIAVGVWDILPSSLSSVYLYYDPDYSFLNLGVFTAIREIEYMREFNKLIDKQFKYYMMGFYIDTCQKMRYKGFYHPTELLDPITQNYVYLDKIKSVISDGKLHKLSEEKNNPKYPSLNEDEINSLFSNTNIYEKDKNKYINLPLFINKWVKEKYRKEFEKRIKRFIFLLRKHFYSFIEFES